VSEWSNIQYLQLGPYLQSSKLEAFLQPLRGSLTHVDVKVKRSFKALETLHLIGLDRLKALRLIEGDFNGASTLPPDITASFMESLCSISSLEELTVHSICIEDRVKHAQLTLRLTTVPGRLEASFPCYLCLCLLRGELCECRHPSRQLCDSQAELTLLACLRSSGTCSKKLATFCSTPIPNSHICGKTRHTSSTCFERYSSSVTFGSCF